MTASVKTKPNAVEPEVEAEPTFTFHPTEGDPIVMPQAAALWKDVDGKGPTEFLWEIRKMNETYQSFEFMDRAKVDDEMQRRIVRLPAEERRKLFRDWFADLNRPPIDGELPPES